MISFVFARSNFRVFRVFRVRNLLFSIRRIQRIQGSHVFPDSFAHGHGENPQWLYTVTFSGRELWGDDSDPTLVVSIDAFEPYLEPA